jgi:hypothetical protein
MNTHFVVISILALILTRTASAADGSTFVELPYGYVIGGHAAGKWLTSEQAGRALKPGTAFRLFNLKGAAGKMTVSKAAPDADVCPDVWIAQINRETDAHAIAIAATWNPMPRPVTSAATTQEAYVKAVSDVLAGKGIKKPVVKIAQHLRADLDGDGEEEVLLSATHYPDEDGGMGAPMAAAAGNYSFVALRRVVGGKVVTQILNGEFYPKAQESSAPNIHEVGGLLDLDGDGRMEIILDSTYYEGGGTTVWRLDARKAVKVLEIECGV